MTKSSSIQTPNSKYLAEYEELLSKEYYDQLVQYRTTGRPNWGNGGGPHMQPVIDLIHSYRRPDNLRTVIDYGCGHGLLLRSIVSKGVIHKNNARFYDPGIEEYAEVPTEKYDLLVSTDVLEHIEPELLENVLKHMHELTRRIAYLNIHTGPANAILPDGRNAHLIQKPATWWREQLEAADFRIVRGPEGNPLRATFICEP